MICISERKLFRRCIFYAIYPIDIAITGEYNLCVFFVFGKYNERKFFFWL